MIYHDKYATPLHIHLDNCIIWAALYKRDNKTLYPLLLFENNKIICHLLKILEKL